MPRLLPERDPAETARRLAPVAGDPELGHGLGATSRVVGGILGSPEFQRR